MDFLKEMPQLSLKAGYILSGLYGSDWEKRLEVLDIKGLIVSPQNVASRKFKMRMKKKCTVVEKIYCVLRCLVGKVKVQIGKYIVFYGIWLAK